MTIDFEWNLVCVEVYHQVMMYWVLKRRLDFQYNMPNIGNFGVVVIQFKYVYLLFFLKPKAIFITEEIATHVNHHFVIYK